jgi:hypothetical protein
MNPEIAFSREPGTLKLLRANTIRLFLSLSFFPAAASLITACHSYHVDATVENLTGGPVQLLEVDYPSASFGADKLAAGEVFHYRVQLRGTGPLKVQYTEANGHQASVDGPTVKEPQEGTLEILLRPDGHAEFHPHLSPVQH